MNSKPFDGRQIMGMDCNVGESRCSNWRHAMVGREPLLGIVVSKPCILNLLECGPTALIASSSLLLRRGARISPPATAVVADAVTTVLHRCVVRKTGAAAIHMIHCGIVVQPPVVPARALVTVAGVSEAIVDPAIET